MTNRNTPTIDPTRCFEQVSGRSTWHTHQCSKKGKYLDQPRATLGTAVVETKVGELTDYEALMGIDNRETKREWLPIYGPVEPRLYCAQHSPSQKRAKEQAARDAQAAKYAAEQRAVDIYKSLVDQITELVELKPYEASVSHRREHNGNYYANGVLLTAPAARAIIKLLEDHRPV